MSKVKFSREILLISLKKALSFVPKKATIFACETFLFKIVGDTCFITATDMDKQVTVQCKIKEPCQEFNFTIPARLLVSSISLMIDEDVTFDYKGIEAQPGEGTVTLRCGKSKYKMNSTDGSIYPIIEPVKSDYEASFLGASFNKAIEIAKKYTESKGINQFTQGVCLRLDAETKRINVFATTGHQICKMSIEPRSIHSWDDAIIPVDAVIAINKCIDDSSIVDITHNKSKIEVTSEDVSVISKLFDLKYPNVEVFYAKKREASIKLNTVQVKLALERLQLLSSEEYSHTNIRIHGSVLTLESSDESTNRAGEELIEVHSTLNADIGINTAWLLSALSCFDNDEFTFEYTDTKTIVSVEPINIIGENYLSLLIAPIKI